MNPKHKLFILVVLAISPLMINGYINAHIYQNPLLYWLFELFSWVGVPLVVWFIARQHLGITANDIGITNTIFEQKSIFLILLFSAILAPTIFLVYKQSYLFFEGLFSFEPLFEYETMIPQSGILKFIIALYFSISAGLVEEFYRALVHKLSTYYAHPQSIFVILSPIIFALPHWEDGMGNLCATYVVGLFLALIFLVSKNLIPLILGHIYTDMLWFN